MSTQTIFFSIFILVFAYFLYKKFKYEEWLKKEAKASVERFNKLNQTDFTYFEFARINQRNPDWLSLEPSKQKELLEKHGYAELAYTHCL